MALSTEQVIHIAKLARLHLTIEEVETYRHQIDSILSYIEKLQEVDTTGVPELQHTQEMTNVFRDDMVEACDATTREIALENFAYRQGDLLEVQAVFSGLQAGN